MIVCQDQNSLIAKGIEEFKLKAQSRGMYQNRTLVGISVDN